MKKVIILDYGNSAYDCPFDTEVWTTARMLPNIDPNCSKVFIFGNRYKRRKAIKIATENNIPIVSTEDYATEPFPYDEIVKEFKIGFFMSPASYMFAYALYLGYEEIGLYGVDHEGRDNPTRSRLTYWLGIAKGRGAHYTIAKSSRLYRVMRDFIEDRRRDIRQRVKDARDSPDFIDIAESGNDPFCFVTGIDADAVTITSKSRSLLDGKERIVSKWAYRGKK